MSSHEGIDAGREIDWGKTSSDYAQHRPGPPESFYDRLQALGIGTPGQRILDLGTGTGHLARSFARRGCVCAGVDLSACALARRYGGRAAAVLDLCRADDDGLRELDPETRLGEVEWAVRHEDAQGLTDVFFRRTDLGHDPARAEAAVDPVVERMGALLRWDAARREAERAELEVELRRRRRWKN